MQVQTIRFDDSAINMNEFETSLHHALKPVDIELTVFMSSYEFEFFLYLFKDE